MYDFTMFHLVYVLVACVFIMHAKDIADLCLDTIARIGGYGKYARRICVQCGSKHTDESLFCSTFCSVEAIDAAFKEMLPKLTEDELDQAVTVLFACGDWLPDGGPSAEAY